MFIHHQAAKYGRELTLPEVEVVENEPATICPKGQVESQTPSFRRTQEQMGSKTFAWSVPPPPPPPKKREGCRTRQNPELLTTLGLKSETGFIIAAQDQCIKNNCYRNKVLKDGTDPMCRICGLFQETVDHLVSGCSEHAKTEYIHRHKKAAAYLHWTVSKNYNIKVQDKHYEHEPATVTESETTTIL